METAMTCVRTAIALALLGGGSALAQEAAPRNPNLVYKCMNADGSVVYAQTPCSNDPKKVQTIDTTGALRTGSGGHQGEISAGVADSDCRDAAYKSTHASADKIEESNRHIAEYRQRRQALDAVVTAYGGSDAQTSKAMEDLDVAIAHEAEFQQREKSFSEQNYANALKACDNARSAAPPANPPAAKPPRPPAANDAG